MAGATGRLIPLSGTEAQRASASASILTNEVHSTSDQKRLFLQNEVIAPYWHGDVASEAAMTALSSSTRGVWRGDSCRRTDLSNRYFFAINNDGSNATDWVDLNNFTGSSGDIIYHNGTRWVSLPKGTDGQTLTLGSGLPSWVSGGSGSGNVLSGLFTNMVAFFPFDALSGNRKAAFGDYELVDNATVTVAAGKTRRKSALFTAANSEFLNMSNAGPFDFGDEDFYISCWVYLASKGSNRPIVNRYRLTSNQRSFNVEFGNVPDRFRFVISSDGTDTNQTVLNADTLGSPATATWYFIEVYNDSVNNEIGIRVNQGGWDTAAHSGGAYASSTAEFSVGKFSDGTTYWDGRIQDLALWQGIPNSSDLASLYNSGTGLTFPFGQ